MAWERVNLLTVCVSENHSYSPGLLPRIRTVLRTFWNTYRSTDVSNLLVTRTDFTLHTCLLTLMTSKMPVPLVFTGNNRTMKRGLMSTPLPPPNTEFSRPPNGVDAGIIYRDRRRAAMNFRIKYKRGNSLSGWNAISFLKWSSLMSLWDCSLERLIKRAVFSSVYVYVHSVRSKRLEANNHPSAYTLFTAAGTLWAIVTGSCCRMNKNCMRWQ
jgi:hypothetical protein